MTDCKGKKFNHNFIGGVCTKCLVSQSELSYPFKEKKIKLPEPEFQGKKIDYSFQVLGLDMMAWFGKEKKSWLWSLFYKFDEGAIRDAFEVCKKAKIKKINYLLGILKK